MSGLATILWLVLELLEEAAASVDDSLHFFFAAEAAFTVAIKLTTSGSKGFALDLDLAAGEDDVIEDVIDRADRNFKDRFAGTSA